MSNLAITQTLFSEALFQPDKPLNKSMESEFSSHSHLAKRFAVYRNNVHHSLVEALADTYPVIKQLIGEQAFKAAAQSYVVAHPPFSAVLLRFSEGFADFLSDFEPLKQLLYLPDVARLEYLWLTSYQALTSPSMSAESIQMLSENALNELVCKLHPSVCMLQSNYAVGTLWQMHQDESGLEEQLDVDQSESMALVRKGKGLEMSVQLYILGAEYIDFLKSIQAGYTLTEAMALSMQAYPECNMSEVLAFCLNNEFFCAIEAEETDIK